MNFKEFFLKPTSGASDFFARNTLTCTIRHDLNCSWASHGYGLKCPVMRVTYKNSLWASFTSTLANLIYHVLQEEWKILSKN